MRDDMHETRWSPFDPKWYQQAFDKYVSTADQLFNTDDIIQQGYDIPDADGSRSSIFRNSAVLNNSFNEHLLRETLKDIYLNSTHKLIASNHDNVHFFQWNGYLSDTVVVPNTDVCQISIPTETFIGSKERDLFKLSQFYRKWIKIEDILNNWDVFKWCCLLFINQKIYSEYEIRMDDHETVIRFKFTSYWVKQNYPVYIYKFDTNASSRVLISRELCNNQWNWKMPISYIKDPRVMNSTNVIVAINKISDPDMRKDGLTHVEAIGDNLEFLKIEDGYIDLSKISNVNRRLIMSESKESLWMSIIVPKFFHEYPIPLPTDSIYRPYVANFQPVVTVDHNRVQYVKTNYDKQKQVYVDVNGNLNRTTDSWNQMIRPIVLSDAYDGPYQEPFTDYLDELNNLIRLTVKGADIIEEFRFFVKEYTNKVDFDNWMTKLVDILNLIKDSFHRLMDARHTEYNQSYESLFKRSMMLIDELKEVGVDSDWFHAYSADENDFWYLISPLIHIPREFADRFYFLNIITTMQLHGHFNLWDDIDGKYGTIRFRRPIEVQDFWTFEYYPDEEVWRPYPLQITHHFPDVYTLVDNKEEDPTLNRIFKAFFFYSDTINVAETADNIVRATPSWDNDMIEYMYDQRGAYRDVFMEKFYWMGVRAIYSGLLATNNRWEVIEYIMDNDSYERFNDLFLQTMDPYFKMGLSTYFKSDNFAFPFDDAIAKMEENINNEFLDHKRITSFEMYLNKTWIPSYFDYVVKILDGWDCEERLVRRPRNSFDITRLLPMLLQMQKEIQEAIDKLNQDLDWIIEKLKREDYKLNIQNFLDLKDLTQHMNDNIGKVIDETQNLDLPIYSIDDINKIADGLRKHLDLISQITDLFEKIRIDVDNHLVHPTKQKYVNEIKEVMDLIPQCINEISANVNSFDMNDFMLASNDLRGYFTHDKYNPDDKSLIGYINEFDDPWSKKVKEARGRLFVDTATMNSLFDRDKIYSNDEIREFITVSDNVKNDIIELRNIIDEFYEEFKYDKDETVYEYLDDVEKHINTFSINITEYMDKRDTIVGMVDNIKSIIDNKLSIKITGTTEEGYKNNIKSNLDDMIDSLSHIVGVNKRDEALDKLNNSKWYVHTWLQFISDEKYVFDKIESLFGLPAEFLDTLNLHREMINAIIEYMNTVNYLFIPDTSRPTYSDIYEADETIISSGGLMHNIGDNVFAPGLGSFVIDEVSDGVNRCLKVSDLNYRRTTFRDPKVQTNPYDSITSGAGLGIMMSPKHIKHQTIINDDVVVSIREKINNILQKIDKSIEGFNPYNNTMLKDALFDIQTLGATWKNIVNVYKDYMTKAVYEYMNKLINTIIRIEEPLQNFIEERNKIALDRLLGLVNDFINESSKYSSVVGQNDENYYYYEEKVREKYSSLFNYYGNGTQWGELNSLKMILMDTSTPINIFYNNVVSEFPDGTNKDRVCGIYTQITDLTKLMLDTVMELPNVKIDVTQVMNNINELIGQFPELHRDVWYKITSINIAIDGSGYKVGDIVEIVPKLPIDDYGEQIHDQEELIMNDVLLVQVSDVDENGRVLTIKPFMDYAIPYMVYGIRETRTRTGEGSGLTIDVFSKQIELSDCTLFNDESFEELRISPFDENDMLVFKFENIHDLDMNYEVFLGGKQIQNYYIRHVDSDNPLHPGKIDVIYVNANEIMDLQNSSVFIPGTHYFMYKLDSFEVKDPGAGYCLGQDIYVPTDTGILKLQVTKLTDDPFKGIAEVRLGDSSLVYNGDNPTCVDAEVVTDSMNNIDDEYNTGYYDRLTFEGIEKPATRSYDADRYTFKSERFDKLRDGDRNKNYMYPNVDMKDPTAEYSNGDPDSHWYLGSRIDNSQHPMTDKRRWNGINNIIPPTDPFLPDVLRVPSNLPIKGEYQEIASQRFHNSEGETNENVTYTFEFSIKNAAMIEGDLEVPTFADLPKHVADYTDGKIGSKIIVTSDETNGGHRMLYRIRTFVAAGFFVYDLPEVADYKCESITIDWMNCDFYPDYPSMKAQYPSAPWETANTYKIIQEEISDGNCKRSYVPRLINTTTYIDGLTVDDLSVFNWSTKLWENLHDETRWKLDVYNGEDNPDNPVKWGFTLTFLKEGNYSYDMKLYLNKLPDSQKRNSLLKRNAVLDVSAVLTGEFSKSAINTIVNTGRHFRIRKLFPYEQKETFRVGLLEGTKTPVYEMNVKLANYIHFRNEIHLEDIKVYNKTAGRFENILDPKMFEVQFKDPKAVSRGYETNPEIIQCIIADAGEGFIDGEVWAYNKDFGINVFGYVKTDFNGDGHLISFKPIHCPNPPLGDFALEFDVYQSDNQSEIQRAIVMIEFHTERKEVYGDGYIHNVTNRLAPLPKEFKIIIQYNLDEPTEYEIIISKTQRKWTFVEPTTMVSPTFTIDGYNIQQDRLYILTDKGRLPLISPATGKPSFYVTETERGTSVQLLNIYRRFEHLQIVSTPYPMRSVYTLRRIPQSGYIDLRGKINKPLNKKYFEFWVNGKLMYDEVTIISPTKIFLHGLKSLKNLEIIEINRDANEFFSDTFMNVSSEYLRRPYKSWDYQTYLDAALDGTLEGDNYTTAEQEYLLTPVWKQVPMSHPEYKNYPPNIDIEDDILVRVDSNDVSSGSLESPAFQFLIINPPTIEGQNVSDRTLKFEHFGFKPITDSQIIDILNEEWAEEFEGDSSSGLHEHSIITDDEWYGTTARLYDEFGILVHNLNETAYYVADDNLMRVNTTTHLARIMKNQAVFNLD